MSAYKIIQIYIYVFQILNYNIGRKLKIIIINTFILCSALCINRTFVHSYNRIYKYISINIYRTPPLYTITIYIKNNKIMKCNEMM